MTITSLLPLEAGGTYYPGRLWINTFAGENTEFQSSGTYTNLEQRTGFFTSAYSDSPGMVVNIAGKGAKYLATMKDANGDWLDGGKSYSLHLPPGLPAALFWSVALSDNVTASGLDNGQPFPLINTMDKPAANADGSHDIYFGPDKPAKADDSNWLRTGLLRHPAPLRPRPELLRPDLEARRPATPRLSPTNIRTCCGPRDAVTRAFPRRRPLTLYTAVWDWRPGRVYFVTLLEPLYTDNRSLALTARSASLRHRR